MAAENSSVSPDPYLYTYKEIQHFLKYESELPVFLFPTEECLLHEKYKNISPCLDPDCF